MQIRINGELQQLNGTDINVAAMLAALQVDVRQVAVEKNGAIVPRSRYGSIMVVEGDVIELVEFVGGG